MRVIKTLAIVSLSLVGLWVEEARALVSAGADTDTKIRIGQSGYDHEVLHDFHQGIIYTEANAHSNLPHGSSGICEAEAHAKRFHLDLPWPIPDVIWQSCWVRTKLSDGYNPKSAAGKASAWGSWFIIDGPPGEMTQMSVRVPKSGSLSYDLPPDGIPSQGMFADSFFDVFVAVDIAIAPPGQAAQKLLRGAASLGGQKSTSPGLGATGDLLGANVALADIALPDGSVRKQMTLVEDLVSPVTVSVPTNVPFEAVFDLTIEIPARDAQLSDGDIVTAAAAFAGQLELVDQSGKYNLRAVPGHPGDANGDGEVDDADASILAANWLRTGDATWTEADFNGDGNVDDLDASILAANWQSGVGSAVPEPSGVGLALLGLATLLVRPLIRPRRGK